MKKKNSINILSLFLSFLIMTSILSLFAMTIGKYSGLSIRGVVHACERTEYYRGAYNDLIDEASYIGKNYGIDRQYIEDTINYSKFIGDVNKKILGSITQKPYTANTDYINKNIIEKIEKVEGQLTDEQKKSVESYCNKFDWIYDKKTDIAGIENVAKLIKVTNDFAIIVIPLSLIILILSIMVLFAVRAIRVDALRYVVYSTTASGLILLISGAAILTAKEGYRFNISLYYLKRLYAYLISHLALMAVIYGAGIILISLLLTYYIRESIKKISLL